MLLAVGAAGCGQGAGRSAAPGHLEAGDPTTTDAPIRIGDTITYGTMVLGNTGHDDVVLRRAVVTRVRGPVEVVGTGIHPATGTLVGAGPWPPYPTDPLRPVRGARLAPGEQAGLVLGLRRTAAGP